MRVASTSIAGCFVFSPTPHVDSRGFFSRTFEAAAARSAGIDPNAFVQDSLSRSRMGVLRGLHLRRGAGESKLVRCSSGAVFDVVVDLRADSPSFGRWEAFDLDGESQRSVYVPAGCAHGFQALTEPADTAYRIDREHDPSEDVTILFSDPDLAITWPLPLTGMSAHDRSAPTLAALGIAIPGAAGRHVPKMERDTHPRGSAPGGAGDRRARGVGG